MKANNSTRSIKHKQRIKYIGHKGARARKFSFQYYQVRSGCNWLMFPTDFIDPLFSRFWLFDPVSSLHSDFKIIRCSSLHWGPIYLTFLGRSDSHARTSLAKFNVRDFLFLESLCWFKSFVTLLSKETPLFLQKP